MQKKIVTFLILVTVIAVGIASIQKGPPSKTTSQISLADSQAVSGELLTALSFAQIDFYKNNRKQFASNIEDLLLSNLFLKFDKTFSEDVKKAFSQKQIESFKGYFYKFLTTKDKSSFSILAFPEKGLNYPCYFLNQTMLVYECDKTLVAKNCHDTKDVDMEKCKILLYVDK